MYSLTDKELLELIEKSARHQDDGGIVKTTEINTDHFEWLVKQAKKVEDLQGEIERLKKELENSTKLHKLGYKPHEITNWD